jgi:LPS export ABC transporter protein LptC
MRMRKLARSTWMIAALAAACSSPQEPAAVAGDFEELPADQIMTDVVFRPTNGGIATALLHADTVYMYQDSSRYDLVGVDLEMYDETGALSGTLTSKTGEYSTINQAMVGRGDVVLITQDAQDGERRIETEELHYDPSMRRIWSDVPTVMYTAQGPIRGSSFSADDGFNNVTVTQYRGALPGGTREER